MGVKNLNRPCSNVQDHFDLWDHKLDQRNLQGHHDHSGNKNDQSGGQDRRDLWGHKLQKCMLM